MAKFFGSAAVVLSGLAAWGIASLTMALGVPGNPTPSELRTFNATFIAVVWFWPAAAVTFGLWLGLKRQFALRWLVATVLPHLSYAAVIAWIFTVAS